MAKRYNDENTKDKRCKGSNEWLINFLGRGGGLVVSMLAFYSDDPSSIPAEVYNFYVKLLMKRMKIIKKRLRLVHF